MTFNQLFPWFLGIEAVILIFTYFVADSLGKRVQIWTLRIATFLSFISPVLYKVASNFGLVPEDNSGITAIGAVALAINALSLFICLRHQRPPTKD